MNRHTIAHILKSNYERDLFATKAEYSDKDSYFVNINGTEYFTKTLKNNTQFSTETISLKILQKNLFNHIPKLIDTIPSRRMIIQEKMDGSSWSDLLFKLKNSEKKEIVINIAKTLSALHKIDINKFHGIKYKSMNSLLKNEYDIFLGFYKIIVSNISIEKKTYNYILDNIHSDYLSQTCILKKYFIHNDLWSGNIFISTSPYKKVIFCDFESAIISTNLIDIGRIYTRGLVSRNYEKPYYLNPDSYLWTIFKEYYFDSITDIENSRAFIKSILYSVLRTINYYIKLSLSSDDGRYLQSIERIIISLFIYLKEKESG